MLLAIFSAYTIEVYLQNYIIYNNLEMISLTKFNQLINEP